MDINTNLNFTFTLFNGNFECILWKFIATKIIQKVSIKNEKNLKM